MPWRVGEHLHLDVAAVLDVLLDEHGVVAEGRIASRLAAATASAQLVGAADDAHALAAAAGGGLDEDGKPSSSAWSPSPVGTTGTTGPGGDGDLAGGVLAAHLRPSPSADGPTSLRPASSTARAKAGRSDRNP